MAVRNQATFVVQTERETYEVRQLPLPQIGPDDGLLEVEACGVCGTDVEVFEGLLGTPLPIVPGHEPFGRIVAIGDSARRKWGVQEGDRVAVHSTLTCGRCRTCRAGLRGCTAPEFADTTVYGFRSPDVSPGLWGGFSTHLYLAPEAILVPMSSAVSVAAASLFNVMSNGVDWVLEAGGARADMPVAILGPGPRGLASVIAAKATRAGPIAVTGLASDRDRLALALELGADHALDVTGKSVAQEVLAAMGEAPQLVVDCTPMWVNSVTDAVMMAGRKGTVVLAGMKGPNGMAPLPVDTVSSKQLTIKGVVSRSMASMEHAIKLIESQRWPFERFASHSFGLADADKGVSSLMGDNKPIHVRIEPGDGL
ncbi:MAG TPA: alcohol dehydrogenase catalytic domain-containing protein [Acidimicrobiales bacterium]|nr:alcohol dehydrogenase catalytic domain-containing protein [Acidimicrobiales bacterium]